MNKKELSKMKLLICQAPHEDKIEVLEKMIVTNKDVTYFLFPEGYINSESSFDRAKELAKDHSVNIITSLRIHNNDLAVIINSQGENSYRRYKTNNNIKVKLNSPLCYHDLLNKKSIGFLLCMEILKGERDLPKKHYDLIVHPIGVGMFSEEQLDIWIGEAKKITKKYRTMIVGVSHSDGSYKNCGVSIPISYCINREGKVLHLDRRKSNSKIIDIDSVSP